METYNSSKEQSWLVWFYKGIIFLSALFLFTRLFELQIIKGAYYKNLAENNRIRKIVIEAPRGKIIARGGEILVGNEEIKNTVEFLPESGLEKKLATSSTPEDEIIIEWKRDYLMGEKFAHVSGYLGEINEEEVKKVDAGCIHNAEYSLGNLIGRTGLESQYECLLRGTDGEELVEVNTFGEKLRTLGRKPAIAGSDIKTTIDIDLQNKVATLLDDVRGAIIVTDVHGEVLALYSSPSYDPNNVSDYINNSDLPLFNRVIAGAFHPGSVFKLVTSIAALEEGRIDSDFTYEDTGSVSVDEFTYTTWYFTQYGRTEGVINLVRALARSTDTFFYKVGEAVGAEKLSDWAFEFGLGKKTEIDLPGEITGLVPTPDWKKRVKGEYWYLGNTYHMSIGQGDLAVTPLGANMMTSVIANDGKLCKPHIKNGDEDCKDLDINQTSIDLVEEGMIAVCSDGGTAFPFFDFTPTVACKTGTAETPDEDKTHAWFTAYGPVDFPEIVVTVLVEEGGEGSDVAAPIAREIFDYWFEDK